MLFVKVIVLCYCRLQLHRLRAIFRELVSHVYHELVVVKTKAFEMRGRGVSMKMYKLLVGKPERNGPIRRFRHTWNYNSKI